jgi:hypothetical protein
MIEEKTTVTYGDTAGYVRLDQGLERSCRGVLADGPIGYTMSDNRDGTVTVYVSGMPDAVRAVIAYADNFR